MTTFFIAILSVEAKVTTFTPMSQKGDEAYETLPQFWRRQALNQLCNPCHVYVLCFQSTMLKLIGRHFQPCPFQSRRSRLGAWASPPLPHRPINQPHQFQPKPQFQIPMGDRVRSTSDFGSSQRSSQTATLCHRLTLARPSRPFRALSARIAQRLGC